MIDKKMLEPKLNNLPEGLIDWLEISDFIVYMLESDIYCKKGWHIINDSSITKNLQANSLAVLHILHDDLYEYFFKQKGERFDVWQMMEQFIRSKYRYLSDKALSRIIAVYHIDDR